MFSISFNQSELDSLRIQNKELRTSCRKFEGELALHAALLKRWAHWFENSTTYLPPIKETKKLLKINEDCTNIS
jgi:hypothetical protein